MKNLIRTLALVLTFAVLMTSVSLISAFALKGEDYYISADAFYGDTDDDLKITVKDATAVQKHLAKITELERKQVMISDVDGNGKLTISDATDIQKYLANIIYCFEVAPTEYCEADGETVRVELTTEEPEKITVKIPKTGYYRFMSRKIEGGSCSFEIFDGHKHIDYAYSDSSIAETYVYLSAGRCTVSVEPSWEYEKDVLDFSVTSANDKIPFDLSDVKELNAGEKVDVKAGTGTLVYKVDPADLEDPAHGLILYTKGTDPKVKINFYNSYLCPSSHSFIGLDDINAESDLLTSSYYAVVTQEEGGSDFTLCCDDYFDYLSPQTNIVELDKTEEIALEEYYAHEHPDGSYRAYAYYKFTPHDSGYYKLTFNAQESTMLFSAWPYYFEKPEEVVFYSFSYDSENPVSMEYLNADTTYYLAYAMYDFENKSTADFVVTKATEQEYNLWYENAYTNDNFSEQDYSAISLGNKEFVTIGTQPDEYGDYYPETAKYKFTADKDMTVVAFSEGSNNAYVEIYDSRGNYVVWGEDSGNLSLDFATVIELEAGETCYLNLSSGDCFEHDDSYFFSVVDISDYAPLS